MRFKLFILYFVVHAISIIIKTNATELCTTPNNETAECIPIRSCPLLLEAAVDKSSSSKDFLQKSFCGFNGTNPNVCCGSSFNFVPQNNAIQKETDDKTKLFPQRRFCGYQHSDDFDHDVNGTLITEFPWLARIAFTRNSDNASNYKKQYLCLGSVISVKYILTSADCGQVEGFTPIEAQLGDYHIVNDTDCVTETASAVEECSDPAEIYRIEKVIIYPNYNPERITNNLALFRLNRKIFFTDYIRPICLPFLGPKFATVGDIVTSSGWGYAKQELEAVVKKRVLTQIISNDDCWERYKHQSKIIVDDKNICVAKLENSTELSCIGDSGSPVIFSYRFQWFQLGIVSAGIGGCGDSAPDVLTKVESYLDWIIDNVKP